MPDTDNPVNSAKPVCFSAVVDDGDELTRVKMLEMFFHVQQLCSMTFKCVRLCR